MPYQEFSPEKVGVCLSTLAPRGAQVDAETVLHACRTAGFKSLAMGQAFAATTGVEKFSQLLKDLDLQVRVIEAIVGWTKGAAAATKETEVAAEFAAVVGADTLMAATIDPLIDEQQAAEGFTTACRIAADSGLKVALEFIPGTAIPDLNSAWRIVRNSGADNAGVVIDCLHWHHQPGGPDNSLLREIPPQRIHYVQLCDSPNIATPAAGQYIPFAMSGRLLPGAGVCDIKGLLSELSSIGADPFYAMEVFNTDLAALGVERMLQQLHDAAEKLPSATPRA